MSSSPENFVPFTAPPSEPSTPEFELGEALWQALTEDAGVKADLEKLVEARLQREVRQRLESREKEVLEQMLEEKRREGLRLGRDAAQAEVEVLREQVNGVCRRIQEAGTRELTRTGPNWVRALGVLLRKFLVRKDREVVERVKAWLEESLEGLEKTAQVRVWLSQDEFDRLSGTFGERGDRWTWAPDSTLKDGEVRCETDTGGAFFSPSEQWFRLEQIIEETVSEEQIASGGIQQKG